MWDGSRHLLLEFAMDNDQDSITDQTAINFKSVLSGGVSPPWPCFTAPCRVQAALIHRCAGFSHGRVGHTPRRVWSGAPVSPVVPGRDHPFASASLRSHADVVASHADVVAGTCGTCGCGAPACGKVLPEHHIGRVQAGQHRVRTRVLIAPLFSNEYE